LHKTHLIYTEHDPGEFSAIG